MFSKDKFGPFDRYTIDNGIISLSVISLGAAVTSLRYKGRENVLHYSTPEECIEDSSYMCVIAGRYANRIENSVFHIDGKEYRLTPSEGRNQLHGGPDGISKKIWTGEVSENTIRMSVLSADGESGYPGNLTATVTYTITGSALRIDFEAVSDADTLYAPTSHLYLNPDNLPDVRAYGLMINADSRLEVDGSLIPTGRFLPAGYETMRVIDEDLDDCFALRSEEGCVLRTAGYDICVSTDFPGLQVYTSRALGEPFGHFRGIAIEAEAFPASPSHPEFEQFILRKGDKFSRYVEYAFKD